MAAKKPFVRLAGAEARKCLDLAMQAKRVVFKAQDAAQKMPAEPRSRERRTLLREVDRCLARARASLERLDNVMTDAMAVDNDHCTCGGFPDGEPHVEPCPLAERGHS